MDVYSPNIVRIGFDSSPYIYLQNWVILGANVGKYTSTMEHMGYVFPSFCKSKRVEPQAGACWSRVSVGISAWRQAKQEAKCGMFCSPNERNNMKQPKHGSTLFMVGIHIASHGLYTNMIQKKCLHFLSSFP